MRRCIRRGPAPAPLAWPRPGRSRPREPNRRHATSRLEPFLLTITNPTIAYILLSMGSLGLLLELYNPGSIFPGVIGGICLLLAFYALGTLPLNFAGLALIGFGLLLFALEPFLTAHGILAAVLRPRRRRVVTGREGLLGATGTVRRELEPGQTGIVHVQGELWQAIAPDGRLAVGENVVVQSMDGLLLTVRRAADIVPAPPRPASPAVAKS